MNKIRSFIAINLPEEIKKHLLVLLEELKKQNRDPLIKWVKPGGLHLTLHFLGYQEEETLKKVGESIQRKINELHLGQNIPRLFITELGGFPNLNRPRVLFISCQEEGVKNLVKKLQKEIGKELENLGIEIDKRPWQIHITLARLKAPTPLRITTNFNELRIKNLSFEVKSIELMKSELRPDGARYTIWQSFKL